MKFFIAFSQLFFFILLSFQSIAKTITVNNNLNSPGQYTKIDEAILACSDGDTLMVAGSSTNYGNLVLNKRLTIIGSGYFPRKDVLLVSRVSIVVIMKAGNKSEFIGLDMHSIQNGEDSVSNIVIRRCNITTGGIFLFYPANNILLLNSLIKGQIVLQNCSNITIANNIIYNFVTSSSSNISTATTNISIKNNLFIGPIIGRNADNFQYINNIFFYKGLSSNTNVLCEDCKNSSFINNIYFNQTSNPLPIGINNNTGSGNLSANPLFMKITLTDATTDTPIYLDDLRLQPNSPGINYGSDGKDVGIYGGSLVIDYPLSGAPPIPQIQSMNITTPVVPAGGTLNVIIRAKKAN